MGAASTNPTKMGRDRTKRAATKAVQEAKEAAEKGDKIAFFTKLAAAAAIIVATKGAGTPAAIGIVAGGNAGSLSRDINWKWGPGFGTSASAQSATDPLMGKLPGVR